MHHRVALVAAVLGGALAPVAAQNSFSGKVTRIERGDQVVVQLDGWQLTVRLHGAQTPANPPFSSLALQWTRARLEGKPVSVQVRGTAAKGVVYGDITVGSPKTDLSRTLLEQGLATWASSYAPNRSDLSALEQQAHRAKRGVWGDPVVEVPRLQKLLPAPAATPAPLPSTAPAPPPTTSGPWLPLVLSLLAVGGLLFSAERLVREARRLRERPTLLTDALSVRRPIKLKGTARPVNGETLTSIAGNIPALYLRELTETFRDGAWRIIHNEVHAVPFLLDDGTGEARVPVENTVYKPIRVARFYNEIPVENWHSRAYSGDTRTQIVFIPPDVTVTVHGRLHPSSPEFEAGAQPAITVVEGDERRLSRRPLQLAGSLVAAAVVVLGLGLWLSASGAK